MRRTSLDFLLGIFVVVLVTVGSRLARGQGGDAPAATTQPTTLTRGHITCTIPPGLEIDQDRTSEFHADNTLPPNGLEVGIVVREPVAHEIPQNMFVQAMRQMQAGKPKEDVPLAPQRVTVAGFAQVVHQQYKNERGTFTDRWDYWRKVGTVVLKGELEVFYDSTLPKAKLDEQTKEARKMIESMMSSAVDDRDHSKSPKQTSAASKPSADAPAAAQSPE